MLSGLPDGSRLRRSACWALAALAFVSTASFAQVSDDFFDSTNGLLPHWTVIDPLGDATIEVLGAGTGDAQLAISVPAGTRHSAWDDGITAPRAIQSVPDTDFEVEIQFESAVFPSYQQQGLLVENGLGDFIRFEVHGRKGRTYLYVATVTGGVPTPVYKRRISFGPTEPVDIRVGRSEDLWTLSYSLDDGINFFPAVTFSHAFSVSTLGVYAGNSGSNPAHTALIDYFYDTSAPIDPEDGGLEICGLLLDTTVFGLGTIAKSPDDPAYDCNDVVTLTALPDVDQNFNGWSGDASGFTNPIQVTMTGDLQVSAEFLSVFDPAIVSNVQVLPLIDAARISWETNEPATTRVDYGPTPAYEDGFVEDATLKTSHFVELTGLTPDSVVHFRISAEDSDLLYSETADQTLVTLPIGADPSAIVSDDFSAATLGPQWTIIDPLGDVTVDLVGEGTPDAHLRIDVPGGVSHSPWAGGNTAPRVMQPVNDVDFEFEAKFESPLGPSFQSQGILVEESPGNYIRFEFFGEGGGLSVFAATFTGDSPSIRVDQAILNTTPQWLRVGRVGDQWTVSYSADGLGYTTAGSFNHVMSPSSIGVWAGNSGSSPPAHVALIDYAFSVLAPVAPEDGFEPCNHTLAVATTGNGSVAVNPDQPFYDCDEVVTLDAIPDPNQLFDRWSGDAGGSVNPLALTMTGNLSISANFVPVPTPPVLNNIQVTPGVTTATVTWETNEPATSRVDYGPSPSEKNSTVESTDLVTLHAVQITGLAAESLTHFDVTSETAAMLSTTSPDMSFVTLPVGSDPSGIDSDDFSRANLDDSLWSYVDPGDDVELHVLDVGTSDAGLVFELPAGAVQALDAVVDTAPRIAQPANNADFALEANFESEPGADGQRQGLLVDSPTTRLRFDVSHDGGGLRGTAATLAGGGELVQVDVPLPSSAEHFLRVERVASTWTLLHSTNGSSWNVLGSFDETLVVGSVGAFSANAPSIGAPSAFVARIDYFQNDGDPITVEDGAVAPDTLPPLVHAVTHTVTDLSADVFWATDEVATSEVLYGTTTAYELGSVSDAALVHDHGITIGGLLPDTLYHFAVVSEDGPGASTTSPDFVLVTAPPPAGEGPIIEIFEGSIQNFGQLSFTQPWVNVLGNASDPDGVATLTYQLNGAPPIDLAMGPDQRRLADLGDFNADIATSDLLEGANTVFIRATDTLGNESTRTVLVNWTTGNVLPETYSIDWSSVTDIKDVAQVIDGRWRIEDGKLISEQVYYDRVVGLGDLTWDEYEVEVPITMYSFDPIGFDPPSGTPAVGILVRWNGHTIRSQDDQPHIGVDLGGIGWVVFSSSGANKLQIYPNSGGVANNNDVPNLIFGVTYIFKFRVETIVGVGGLYRLKVWEQGTAEPADWMVEKQQTLADPQSGSVLLVSNYVDADFGNVVVRQLGNLSPSALPEAYQTEEDAPLVVSAANGVLANDADPENDPLEARLLSDVSNGSLVLNSDGSFTYTPDPEFSGSDSFTYEAFDGRSPSNPAVVDLSVTIVEDAPIALDDGYGIPEDLSFSADAASGVLANDFDPEGLPVEAQLETDVSNGTLVLSFDGSFQYTPNPGFVGDDTFTYRAFDGALPSTPATVTITVADPPTANPDAYAGTEDTDLVVNAASGVLANDSDPRSLPMQALVETPPANGSLSLATDGSFTYTPAPNFEGADSFTYRATSGTNPSEPTQVSLTVGAVEDPPVALPDAYEVEPDGMLGVPAPGVLANDLEPDAQTLTAQLEQDVGFGTLALEEDGSFLYIPDPGFLGSDGFTYRADDGVAPSSPAAVDILVATTLSTRLVAHWPLDAGSGTVAGDASGNGNDGVLSGATWTTDTADGSAHALEVDGTDDRVEVPAFDVSGQALTLALWAYADTFGVSDARMLSKATGVAEDEHYWMLGTVKSGGNRIRARVKAGGQTSTLVANGDTLPKDTWTHVALTYDGATLRIFQDAVEVGSLAMSGDLGEDPAALVAIGNQPAGAGDKPFDGFLDDLRVYDRVLDVAELEDLAGLVPPVPDTTPPSVPGSVRAVPLSTTQVEVSWRDSADDDSGVSGYRVLRDGVEVASGLVDAQYVDSGLTAGTGHSYSVQAEDVAGNLSTPSAAASAQTLAAGAPGWLDPTLGYRLPISVPAGGTTRVDRPAVVDVDFTSALASVGQSAALDLDSLRVVRANASGQVLDDAVPFQFDPSAGFDAATNAVGEIVFLMEGTALGADTRRYDLYFEVVGEGFTPVTTPDLVSVTAGVPEEGQLSYQVDTQNATYFFQEQGASLSSLVDVGGNDWIDYSPGGGSAGEFRGIPNLIFPESEFHPGGDTGIVTVVSQGPLRLRLNAVTADGLWEANWDFFPEHVTMTLEKAGHSYWFLYEGTPGGVLETGVDYMVRSSGVQTTLAEDWQQDLGPEEWVYFHDPGVGRSLYLATHEDDTATDLYEPLNGEMTVFGFGRNGSNDLLLDTVPRTFSFGLFDASEFDVAAKRIRSVTVDLGVTTGAIEQAP